MRQQFLVHHAEDMVAVAVQDISPGPATGRIQSTDEQVELEVVDEVPLGHKVALRDLPAGEQVLKYGVVIGVTTEDVPAGRHVHVHNLKGQRWA